MKVGKKDTAYVSKNSWKGRVLFNIQDKIFTRAKKIVVTNPSIGKEIMNMHHIPKEKIDVIYNSPDLDHFKEAGKKSFNSFTILYAGRVLESKNLQSVLLALKGTDGKLVVCGEGNPEFLKKLAARESLESQLQLLGRLSHQETLEYLQGADVLYVGLDDSPVLEYALPSKVFEYMAAGKPILSIGSPSGDLAELLNSTQAGIHTSKNSKDIQQALSELKQNKEKFSKNAREAAEKQFNTKIQLEKLSKVLDGVKA
jgi:glycosyltransferase involved in cell wall biosynthesis